ncbi:MAG: DUF2934 domain-containing protein [Nitrospirae bacterium]|nr:DUF2934 domain-containing protein [Nitrospirota bacterium]
MNELDKFYDEVAKVAYNLFEKRGKVHGHDMSDWLESEIIVKKRYMIKNEYDKQGARLNNRMKAGKNNR